VSYYWIHTLRDWLHRRARRSTENDAAEIV